MKLIYVAFCAYALVFSFKHWTPVEWHTDLGAPKAGTQERIEKIEREIATRRDTLTSINQRMGSASGSTQLVEEAKQVQEEIKSLEIDLREAKNPNRNPYHQ